MEARLLEPNLEILGRLIESPEASQNFIESILNDAPDTKVTSVENISVSDLSDNKLTGKAKEDFSLINGVLFSFNADGQKCEMALILESVPYMKWWHDKSFFCDKLYRIHCQTNDSIKRFVTFLVTDMDVKASTFHSISRFNNRNGEKNETFTINDIFTVKETGNEDNMLENWIRALVTKEEATSDNVSNISDAQNYRVA